MLIEFKSLLYQIVVVSSIEDNQINTPKQKNKISTSKNKKYFKCQKYIMIKIQKHKNNRKKKEKEKEKLKSKILRNNNFD